MNIQTSYLVYQIDAKKQSETVGLQAISGPLFHSDRKEWSTYVIIDSSRSAKYNMFAEKVADQEIDIERSYIPL